MFYFIYKLLELKMIYNYRSNTISSTINNNLYIDNSVAGKIFKKNRNLFL